MLAGGVVRGVHAEETKVCADYDLKAMLVELFLQYSASYAVV